MGISVNGTVWQRWIHHPQTTWLRKAIFQVHLWSGIGVGMYVLFISVTGSVLVWRNELAAAATRDPIIVVGSGVPLTDEQLKEVVTRSYPGYSITINRESNPDQAVETSLQRGTDRRARLVNPYTGDDLGDSVPFGLRAVNELLVLHDDLLAGSTGRQINGTGALLLVVLSFTGSVIWWPGIARWRRSLTVHRHVGWRRFWWDVHSMIGFWGLVVIAMFGLSGVYLCSPDPFQNLADWLEPLTPANAGIRIGDRVIYWLAYLHFGRIGGIGIPCTVRSGLCDFATKSVWTALGLLPGAMFVTGAVMWWNRVIQTKKPSALSGRGRPSATGRRSVARNGSS